MQIELQNFVPTALAREELIALQLEARMPVAFVLVAEVQTQVLTALEEEEVQLPLVPVLELV